MGNRAFIPSFSLLFAAFVLGALEAQAPAPPRSTRDGVYTQAQAERGHELFRARCEECHTENMWKPEWDSKTVADLYLFISQNMPEPAPGTLNAQEVRDAISVFLKGNGLPAGSSELPASLEAMRQIRMERPR